MPAYIAVFLPLETSWGRTLLQGVEARCAERGLYAKVFTGPIVNPSDELNATSCRGVVMMPQSLRSLGPSWQAAQLLERNLRVVNCSSEPLTQSMLHSVCSDARAVGRMSGRYLKQLGVRQIGTLAPWGMIYNQIRLKHLRRECPDIVSSTEHVRVQVKALCQWLREVDVANTAVVVDTAKRAQLLLDQYRGVLPHILCWEESPLNALLKPSITTIDLAFDDVGRAAVDQLLSKRWPPADSLLLVPPRRVIERESTQHTGNESLQPLLQAVAKALPLRPSLDELASKLGTTQRTLTRHVRQAAGCSVLQLINPIRAQFYAQCITQGQQQSKLARQAGFCRSARAKAFYRALAVRPHLPSWISIPLAHRLAQATETGWALLGGLLSCGHARDRDH